MRKIQAFLLLCLLFTLSSSLIAAQTVQSNTAANESWQKFYSVFRAAAKRRDRIALRRMMADDFFDGGGGGTANDWLDMVDRNKMWQAFQRSLAQGTVPFKNGPAPSRITRDRNFIFEFRKRWYFTAIMGD